MDHDHFDHDADVGVTIESMSVGGQPILGFRNCMGSRILSKGHNSAGL